jgi:hypothetical protein
MALHTALLGTSLLTYRYGLALGVWWGASASTMICFLSLISIQAKRRAPNGHTLLELIKVRYGTFAHILWIFLCLVNNILVFSSMLLGSHFSDWYECYRKHVPPTSELESLNSISYLSLVADSNIYSLKLPSRPTLGDLELLF